MKLKQVLYIFSALIGLASSVYAEGNVSHVKIQSPRIIDQAVAGNSQELIVEFHDENITRQIAKRRKALESAHSRMRLQSYSPEAIKQADANYIAEDMLLVNELQEGLRRIKEKSLIGPRKLGLEVVIDFPNLSSALVKLSSIEALRLLETDTSVRYINNNGDISVSADWARGSYTDLQKISANTDQYYSGAGSGSGTRVVVLDQPAYLAALIGFNKTADYSGCLPYRGQNFTNDNLAGGSDPTGGNCRVWDAYNFATRTDQYCANSYGNPYGQVCPHDHGNAVMQTILRTATSTYITALQVFDKYGNGKESYILDALNWVIQNRATQPKIVAVNLSLRLGDVKYTSTCDTVSVASAIKTLVSYNITPVVASGNFGWSDGVTAPACVSGVLAVGAVTDSDTAATTYTSANCSDPALSADQVACLSNYHPSMVRVLAPGIGIGNSMLADELKHSGTSLAAPHVSGQVAIIKGVDRFPFETTTQVSDRIKYNGTPIRDRRRGDIDGVATRIDIKKSISPPKIASMKISPAFPQVRPGGTTKLWISNVIDVNGSPMPVQKIVQWSSSNSSVASVDQAGMVVGKIAGSTVITAISNGVSTTTNLRVVAGGCGPNCRY